MLTQATWLVSWEEWAAREREEGRFLSGWVLRSGKTLAGLFLAFVSVLTAFVLMAPIAAWSIAFLAFGGFCLILAFWVGRIEAQVSAGVRGDLKMLDEIGRDVDAWLVELTIRQGGTVTGRDRGVVWFEDHRLLFSGHVTSFALPRRVVDHPPRLGRWSRDRTPSLAIVADGPLREWDVLFEPIVSPVADQPWARTDLGRRMALLLSLPKAEGPGQLPSSTLGPGAPQRWELVMNLTGAILTGSPLVFMSLAGFLLLAMNPAIATGLGSIGVGISAVKVPEAWRALRSRDALERRRLPLGASERELSSEGVLDGG